MVHIIFGNYPLGYVTDLCCFNKEVFSFLNYLEPVSVPFPLFIISFIYYLFPLFYSLYLFFLYSFSFFNILREKRDFLFFFN